MKKKDANKVFIYKRLHEHYQEVTKKYEVAALFLQGSQNYHLDIYTDQYRSDIDSKAIVIPSLDDITNNVPAVSTTMILANNEHIDVKDIRLIFETLIKSNLNYLELLYTDYKIINSKYKDQIVQLIEMRDYIVDYDFVRLLRCIMGMSGQKLSDLTHPFPTVRDKIEKYGYDPKQLHHIVRLNDFIKKLSNNVPFKDALIPDEIDYLIGLKTGSLPFKEAVELAVKTDQENTRLCEAILKPRTRNDEVPEVLNNLKTTMIKKHLVSIINHPIKVKKYRKIFVTSDNHFFHDNIITYENRPYRSVNEMNEEMIKNWNEVVGEEDLTYILGDFSFGNGVQTAEILNRLNGSKILIVGNHDQFLDSKQFERNNFEAIKYYDEITVKKVTFVLSHYPFAANDHNKIQLYGHIHSEKNKQHQAFNLPKNSFNVGVDVNKMAPVNIEDLLYLSKFIGEK